MKRKLLVFVIVTILFLLVTKLTSVNASPFDGEDRVGFPFRFYTYYGGKLLDKAASPIFYNYTNMAIDILVYMIILMLSLKIWGKICPTWKF